MDADAQKEELTCRGCLLNFQNSPVRSTFSYGAQGLDEVERALFCRGFLLGARDQD